MLLKNEGNVLPLAKKGTIAVVGPLADSRSNMPVSYTHLDVYKRQFSGNPSKEFKQAFLDLKKRGMTSLVIDLRNNGGGLLDESIEIANFFLPRGKTLVTTMGKIKQASNTYKTLREPLDLEIPLAVLVNGGTCLLYTSRCV